MVYKITATVKADYQEPTLITMYRNSKVSEKELNKIYKGAIVTNYLCEKVA